MFERATCSTKRESKAGSVTPVRPDLLRGATDTTGHTTMQAWGNQAAQQLLRSGVIQGKLTVSKPGDQHEREADRVADAVMRMPDPLAATNTAVAGTVQPSRIQRLCTECEEETHGASVSEESNKLKAKEVSGRTPAITPKTESRLGGLLGRGHALPRPVRDFFEPRFDQDFSHVRIHNHAEAADVARSIQARAFTLGRDIVFGEGQYSPDSHSGRSLLAHELEHVVQQSRGEASSNEFQRQVDFAADWTNINVANGAGATINDGTFSYHDAGFTADATVTATADTAAELNEWDVGVFQDLVGHWDRYYWRRANADRLGRFVEKKYRPVATSFRDQVSGATTEWYADDEHQLLSGLAPTAVGGRQQVNAMIHHRDFPNGPDVVSGSAVPGMDASDGNRNINIQRTGGRFDAWISAHNTVTDQWRHFRRVNWNYQRSLDFTDSGATLAIGNETWQLGNHGPYGAGTAAPLMAGDTYNTVLNDNARYFLRRVNGWT